MVVGGSFEERAAQKWDRRLRRALSERPFGGAAQRGGDKGISGGQGEQQVRGRLLGWRAHLEQ